MYIYIYVYPTGRQTNKLQTTYINNFIYIYISSTSHLIDLHHAVNVFTVCRHVLVSNALPLHYLHGQRKEAVWNHPGQPCPCLLQPGARTAHRFFLIFFSTWSAQNSRTTRTQQFLLDLYCYDRRLPSVFHSSQ